MQFSEHIDPSALEAYDDGVLIIGGQAYRQAVILGGGHVEVCPDMPPAAQMQPEDFQAAVAGGAEVVLVGTGQRQVFVPPATVAALSAQGIGVESMTTAAACRTFSLLHSEGRAVWAWLHP